MSGRLTLLVTCKNERNNIGPCIDSARHVVDEVLVADSGSTDGTLEYVSRRGDCRIIQREYKYAGDFKNWAIPHATHPWVLILDADERLSPELAREIKQLLASGPAHDGYYITRANHLMGRRVRYTDWARDRLMRLFRRDFGRYEGPSDHGDLRVSTHNEGTLQAPLIHYTTWCWSQYLKKFDRYTRIQAEQWHAAGRRPSYRRMLLQPPLRFLRDYVLFRGFLDGYVGLQISLMSGFYSFMKQAQLWSLYYGLQQRDVEPEAIAAAEKAADRSAA